MRHASELTDCVVDDLHSTAGGTVAYHVTSPHGVRYSLIRVVTAPHLLFVWNDTRRKVGSINGAKYFSDRTGALRSCVKIG